jgi:hypothetical protein
MPVTFKLEPAPVAAQAPVAAPSMVNPHDALDPNEAIVSLPTVSTPAFDLPSLTAIDGQDLEIIGMIVAIVLCFYVIKVILGLIPRILLIGIGACVVYAFLR